MSWSNGPGPTPGDDTFTGTPGGDTPADAGGGNDTLIGDAGDDSLDGGADDDSLDGGAGNDTLLGGTGNDALDGGADDDSLDGGEGDDTLVGGDGNDTVHVGPGQDSMLGGAGTNVLDFSDATAGVAMVLAQDQIFETGFGNVGEVFASGFTVAYGSQHDDGLFAGSQQGDSLFGQGGNDGIFGNDGDDTIEGGDGNDLVSGEAGVDVLFGNDGNDTLHGGQYLFEDPIFGAADSEAATLDGGDGDDVAILNRGDATYALGFTAGASVSFDSIEASNFEAFAVRSGSGNDTLTGGAGNDSFDGGTGSDVLDGADGTDLLVIDRSDATGPLAFTGGPSVSFDGTEATNFEVFKVTTGSGDDSLRGGDGNDTLDGGLGHDSFEGGAGDDVFDGGDPIDTAAGGENPPIIHESDLVTYENSADAISFSLTDGSGLVAAGADGTDELINIEEVIGSAQDDTMEMSWGTETIDILMAGGAGHDSINLVGDSAATLDGGDGNDTISGGFGNDTILGGEGDDSILGGGGDDSIVATPGNDTVEGNAGADSILTGEGDDLVVWRIGDGNDTIDLGDGQDTLDLEGWGGAWTISVAGSTATFTGDGSVGDAELTVLNYDPADSVVCFAEGTRIMTARGEVPVEQLRAGDMALAPGEGAPFKPVRWVGHRRIDIARHRTPAAAAPVLVRAGALGAGVPHRDLRVSPEHAFLLDGHLVPARLLVNGAGIVQETWHRQVTYWHVELERHGVLVAEGALAESYFDDGNRHFFGPAAVVALDPDFAAERASGGYAARACAPVLHEGDPALDRIRLRLPAGIADKALRRA